MTYQIDLILSNISEDDNFENDEIIIRTYIERLEQRIAEYEEFYIHRNEAQYIQDKNTGEMLKYIQELSTPKTCKGCRHIQWVNSIQSYNCIKKVSAGYVSRYGTPCITKDFYCNRYEPKDTQ